MRVAAAVFEGRVCAQFFFGLFALVGVGVFEEWGLREWGGFMKGRMVALCCCWVC